MAIIRLIQQNRTQLSCYYRNSAVYMFNIGSNIIMSVPMLFILDAEFLESGNDDPFPFHSTYSVEQLIFLPVR